MRLLERNGGAGQLSLTKDFIGDDIPKYAILSHTWGADTEEVTYRDLIDGTGKNKSGYKKIWFCGEQAKRDGLQYFWVDTCSIDKSSNHELTTAINSMFRWYQNAARCYVYLSDVSVYTPDGQFRHVDWESAFRNSRWFTRGWTLQELLAPRIVEFYSRDHVLLGDKVSLRQQIQEITGVASEALQGRSLSEFSVEERFLWGEKRKTKQEEDKAYCLLGIFNIHLPLIYGEGQANAMRRLRREIKESAITGSPSTNSEPPPIMLFEGNRRTGREPDLLHGALNHVPLAFYTLTDEPLHLRRSSSSYWKHLTLGGMTVYREVLQACEYEQGKVRFSDFENQFKSPYPTPAKLRDIWTRIAGSMDDTMSKNLALSVIYMLHIERYLDKAPRGKDCIMEIRRKSLERFDDWVECACEWGCGRSWNFANDMGLSIGGIPNDGFPVARWIQIKPYSRRLFSIKKLSLEVKNCQWDWKRTVERWRTGSHLVLSNSAP